MTKRCKHGLDRRFCSLCGAISARASVNSKARASLTPKTAGRRIAAAKPVVRQLDFRFENDGRTLILEANVVQGWRGEPRSPGAPPLKMFCFSEVVDAEWKGGTIHLQVSIFPRPGGLGEEFAAPPHLALQGVQRSPFVIRHDETGAETFRGIVADCATVTAADGVLVARIVLLDEAGQQPILFSTRPNRSGDHMFERLYEYAGVDIQVRCTFKPPRKPPPVEWSFWNRFLPGGRPESNRRKF
jgi:hypothetical protein